MVNNSQSSCLHSSAKSLIYYIIWLKQLWCGRYPKLYHTNRAGDVWPLSIFHTLLGHASLWWPMPYAWLSIIIVVKKANHCYLAIHSHSTKVTGEIERLDVNEFIQTKIVRKLALCKQVWFTWMVCSFMVFVRNCCGRNGWDACVLNIFHINLLLNCCW